MLRSQAMLKALRPVVNLNLASARCASQAVATATATATVDAVPYEAKKIQHIGVGDVAIRDKYSTDMSTADSKGMNYMVKIGGHSAMLAGGRLLVASFLSVWAPTARMLAMSTLEVDLQTIEEGKTTVVIWQGKPVFIRNRLEPDIESVADTPMSALRDPQTDAQRMQNPKWAIMVAICTHLGCIPVAGQGSYGAYLCPCHGSHYDHSGRIRKGPAPMNLEIPSYWFPDENTVMLGETGPSD